MIKRKRLLHLIQKYVDGTANARERRFVEKYYRYFDHKEESSKGFSESEQQAMEERLLRNIHAGLLEEPNARVVPMYRKFRFRIAAIVLLAVTIAGVSFWYFMDQQEALLAGKDNAYQEVIPGSNKAVLTLANGSTIALNQFKEGMLATQGYTRVIKLDSGQLVYRPATGESKKVTGEVLYNTLSTPPSSNYRVVLPDGSKVWLNAASSLRFPTAFLGKERKVEVRGEAYFEVKEDPAHPFVVEIDAPNGEDMGAVQVLGTHFNINAYMDHPVIKATLVDGAIKVIKGRTQQLLKPGQQATVKQRKDDIAVAEVNPKGVIAWKNGLFQFEEEDIGSIMHEIARWYNLEVAYKDKKKSGWRYSGTISRNLKLPEVLKILEMAGFHFKVTGDKIILL